MNAEEVSKRIAKLRRLPKLEGIFELYRAETNLTLKTKTQNKQLKLWLTHFGELQNKRVDRLSSLEVQKILLDKPFLDGHYHTVINLARLCCAVIDFAVAVGITERNPIKEIFSLPLLKKARSLERLHCRARPSLAFNRLRQELKKVLYAFESQDPKLLYNRRRSLLLEINLRTILRPGECVKIQIHNLNLTKHELKVVDTKTLEEFIIPTTLSLESAIKEAFSLFGNPSTGYIFKGCRNHKTHLSSQTLNTALKSHGYKDKLCAHGLRAVAANYFASISTKVLPHIAAACQQHAVGTISEKRYRRDLYFLKDRRKAMRLWNEWLDALYKEVREEINSK